MKFLNHNSCPPQKVLTHKLVKPDYPRNIKVERAVLDITDWEKNIHFKQMFHFEIYFKSDLLKLNHSLHVRENSHPNMFIKTFVSDSELEFCNWDYLIEKA